ncbi:MAG: hypothetical protein GKR88_06630 [Flavobacteriaceae bacterium]|nr:MAG: hypothetical protein GKR88_06630 [Flavobacteriaceae bacterium]
MQIEFWNENFWIYESAGTKVQTHDEGWFWWNNIDSDELRLGVNRVYLKYNIPQPSINTLVPAHARQPVFMKNGEYIRQNGDPLLVRNTSLPFFEIDDVPILNIYIPNLPVIGDWNLDLSTDDIFSESNVRSLYTVAINFLRNNLGSQEKEFIVSYQSSPHEVELIYVGDRYQKFNTHELKKYFYRDWNFVIGTKLTEKRDSWSSNITFQPDPHIFPNFTEYKVDIYGLARRGNEWQGKRLLVVE